MNIILKDDFEKAKDYLNRIENATNDSYDMCRRNVGYILQFLINSNITPFSSAQKFKVKMDKTYFNASNFMSAKEFPSKEVYDELFKFMNNYISRVSNDEIFDVEFESDNHKEEWLDIVDYILTNYERYQYYISSRAFEFYFSDELQLDIDWFNSRKCWQVTLYYLDEDGEVDSEDGDINEMNLSTKELKDLISDGIKGRLGNWSRNFL